MLRSIDKRLILAAAVTLFVGFSFWMGSRVPNLNEKALMGGDAEIELLGFDVVFEIEADNTFIERVLYTAVNWADTNKRGMTFGILFAACLMTLISLFQRKQFRSAFANALMGTVIGAPLGVCVNCAAPIAKGLHAAGMRLETTLAAMIASPTLNVIVLTMLFSLFPWYITLTKLALTAVFILVGIPILVHIFFSDKQLIDVVANLPGQENAVCEIPFATSDVTLPGAAPGERWLPSALWFLKNFAQHLWYIVRTTVPLMALAGLLGALAIVALPWDTLADLMPGSASNKIIMVSAMGMIALMGTFLPVPISFDIIVVAVLMAAGMPVKYAMVLLFTLGTFSIYSSQIVWSFMSRRVAVVLFLGVAAFGVVGGVAAHYTSQWDETRQRQAMYKVLLSSTKPVQRPAVSVPAGKDDTTLVAELRRAAAVGEPIPMGDAERVEVKRFAFQSRSAHSGQMFTRISGETFGIDEPSPFSLLRQFPGRYWGRGVATGDIHNDGWVDLLVAADNLSVKGIALYANKQGKGFIKQQVSIPLLDDLEVLNVSLIDINNDGWLDMFVSTFGGGNHIVYNREGRFTSENVQTLPDTGAVVAAAVAFGDIDTDGDLDIVLGNFSLGYLRGTSPGNPGRSKNVILIQDGGAFTKHDLETYPGETLATLLTDFNGDGALDLIVANDFDVPDAYYAGDGKGAFKEINKESGILPHSTTSSMSIASADINNDLVPEIYVAQIAKGEGAGFAKKMVDASESCSGLKDKTTHDRCVKDMALNTEVDGSRVKQNAIMCLSIADPVHREDCIALHVIWTARRTKDESLCEMIPQHRQDIATLCRDLFGGHITPSERALQQAIPQIDMYNVLLVSNGTGDFVDRSVDMGIAVTGWSWNAKFADVDNDEWQDLYVANGMYPRAEQESNFFFHNQQGKKFADRTKDSGLMDYHATGGYSYVDFDGDGDLDIISMPINGPVRVFRNNTAQGNSLVIELRDEVGNRFGVGGKIIVRYADGSKAQMREIQASGGFVSFDAPAAHFGLGDHQRIDEIEILWSVGDPTRLKGSFEAGARYVVTRRS